MVAARTVRPGDGLYPEPLARAADRPSELRIVGSLPPPAARRVAIVGSRACDEYGRDVTRALAGDLARAGIWVISGGALGVDAVAHEAALEAGGSTVVVLGTGVDVPYPAQHRSLFERVVAAGGALLSEQPDGTPAYPGNFPRRNRIVSALSEAVVVVRAGPRSGALITADRARSQGVPVFAVPGDVRDDLSVGPLALLRRGALLAASAEDVLAHLGVSAAAPAQPGLPLLDADGSALLSALGRRPRHADEVARTAGVSPGAALAGLLTLEIQGLCEQRPGHYFLRRC